MGGAMLRFGRVLRDAASAPLGLSKKSAFDSMPSAPSIGNFFDEKCFWTKANIGPFFTGLLLFPLFYTAAKDAYWTRQMRQVNTAEIVLRGSSGSARRCSRTKCTPSPSPRF